MKISAFHLTRKVAQEATHLLPILVMGFKAMFTLGKPVRKDRGAVPTGSTGTFL